MAQNKSQYAHYASGPRKRANGLLVFLCIILGLLLVASLGLLWLCQSNEFNLEIKLHGEESSILEYGTPYTEAGAEAYFYGTLLEKDPVKVEVETTGNVDSAHLGHYNVTYTASYVYDFYVGQLPFFATTQRSVTIADTIPPQITLISSPEHYTIVGEEYVEEGFTAIDNYDGDLTQKVERTVSEDTVTYRVSDSSGNETVVTRTIQYHDPIPPVLELTGEKILSIARGSEYCEPGYYAQDNYDGDITSSVTVSGEVDTQRIGTYKLLYTATDSFGNETSQTRTVIVCATVLDPSLLPDVPEYDPDSPVPSNGKVIYLTFDDGPSQHTPRLLDILAAYNVKATFFVVSNGNSGMMARMAAEGHTVAMHSTTHNYNRIYSSDEAYFNDLYTIQSIIEQQTGVAPKLLRFPGGTANTVSRHCPGIMTRITQQLHSMGYRYFDWNVSSEDAVDADTVKEVFYNVINGILQHDISFVLQHDTNGASVDAVESIIRWGLANGYTFLPLTQDSPGCVARPVN